MSMIEIDATRLPLLLHELRLPAISRLWREFADRADKEGWPAAQFLSALAELEIAERGRRRIERHLTQARLPLSKTLDNFDFAAVPMLSKARIMALAAGDGWLNNGTKFAVFWAAWRRKKSSRISNRQSPCRTWLSRAVCPHHGSRATLAAGSTSPSTRSSHRQARQIPSTGTRRYFLHP
jgi:hypothetical protein